MNDEISKTQTRRTGRSQSSREQSPVAGDIARDTSLYTKRQRDANSSADPLPTKKARLTGTDTQRPEQNSSVTWLRKREIDSDSDSDNNERQSKRVRLTRKNLTLFNKKMRKKEPNKALGSGTRESTSESLAETLSTTAVGFATQADENGILVSPQSKPPKNLEDIHERLARSRATPPPSESEYNRYVDVVASAGTEATMVYEVGKKLLKEYENGYYASLNQAFTGFPRNVGFNNNLSPPQPDYIEGLQLPQYKPFRVKGYINGAALYNDNPVSLALPHLAGEFKGRGKDMVEASLQSAYDGAALVFARNQALSFIGKPDPPGSAKVTTFTTDGSNLNIFAHYATTSDDGSLEYHQHLVEMTGLINGHQKFKDARRMLRNAQDHAREQSYLLRDQLKEHWMQRRVALEVIAENAPLPVLGGEPPGTTNVYGDEDEDQAGYEIVQQPCDPKSLPPVSDHGSVGISQKRKASMSEGSSHRSSKPKIK
ncbi:hypothetical protein GGS24DRAFT_486036 [Hypoxylon argillaceum]|nr:hypothetical protein GGS24DRAFT_486036 [Hypoxylon argillaceum]